MYTKMENFIASFTDQEIDDQLKGIFDWAGIYKELLEIEQAYRVSKRSHNNTAIQYAEPESGYGEEKSYEVQNEDDNFDDVVIDFELSQRIQEKVSSFSEEETREQLDMLKKMPTFNLSRVELVRLQYDIEACKLHLFELTGQMPDEENVCPSCGAELKANAKFCGKCGKQIQGVR